MSIFYYFTLLVTVPLLLWPLLKNRHIAFIWIGTFFGASILFSIGTYKSCSSGWVSPSIGSQGACSHHGGVISNMNEFGYTLWGLCLISILVKVLLNQTRSNSDKKILNGEETTSEVVSDRTISPQLSANAAKLQDYEKYILGWHQNGLSIDEIVTHLKSKGVPVSQEYIRQYLKL